MLVMVRFVLILEGSAGFNLLVVYPRNGLNMFLIAQ
jgi:hypothetical protein